MTYCLGSYIYLMWRFSLAGKRNLWTSVLVVTVGPAVAFMSEFIQFYIPGRTFNIYDFIFNSVGLLCGLILFETINIIRTSGNLKKDLYVQRS